VKSGEPPLDVTLRGPALAPAILGDAEQLSIALRHLLRFATGSDGRGAVALELEVAPGRVELAITGAAPIKLPPTPTDLLVPYQDVHGTGRSGSLELAAAYGIFRSHKGTLDVSGAPGGGVRFFAVLPLPPELGEAEPAAIAAT